MPLKQAGREGTVVSVDTKKICLHVLHLNLVESSQKDWL